MKKPYFLSVILLSAILNLSPAFGSPKIQFDKTDYDFGKVSGIESVSGSFKLSNAGDAVLKLQPPATSCGCTVAALTKDTLNPGEATEVEFTLKFGSLKGALEKTIMITSNDPKSPQSFLKVKVDYTPLYEVAPLSLVANLSASGTQSNLSINITRIEGKPVQIERIETSKPWIVTKVDPASKVNEGTAWINVEVRGDAMPGRFNEFIRIYASENKDKPIATVSVIGQVRGDITVSPERLFWSITQAAQARIKSEHPEQLITRRITVGSMSGTKLGLKNLQCSIKELDAELHPSPDASMYDIILRLRDVPTKTLSGKITFETELPSQPKVEVPVTLSVVNQPFIKVTPQAPVPSPSLTGSGQ